MRITFHSEQVNHYPQHRNLSKKTIFFTDHLLVVASGVYQYKMWFYLVSYIAYFVWRTLGAAGFKEIEKLTKVCREKRWSDCYHQKCWQTSSIENRPIIMGTNLSQCFRNIDLQYSIKSSQTLLYHSSNRNLLHCWISWAFKSVMANFSRCFGTLLINRKSWFSVNHIKKTLGRTLKIYLVRLFLM